MADRWSYPVHAAIPDEFRSDFSLLQHELERLHRTWGAFKGLFRSDRSRYPLLNWASPSFFGDLMFVLPENVLLGLCRMSDPPVSGKRENLSLPGLVDRAAPAMEPDLLSQLRKRVALFGSDCACFRGRRNRELAHRDLETALRDEASLLSDVEHMLDVCLAHAGHALNLVEFGYCDRETNYLTFEAQSGVDQLVAVVELARRAELAGQSR